MIQKPFRVRLTKHFAQAKKMLYFWNTMKKKDQVLKFILRFSFRMIEIWLNLSCWHIWGHACGLRVGRNWSTITKTICLIWWPQKISNTDIGDQTWVSSMRRMSGNHKASLDILWHYQKQYKSFFITSFFKYVLHTLIQTIRNRHKKFCIPLWTKDVFSVNYIKCDRRNYPFLFLVTFSLFILLGSQYKEGTPQDSISGGMPTWPVGTSVLYDNL